MKKSFLLRGATACAFVMVLAAAFVSASFAAAMSDEEFFGLCVTGTPEEVQAALKARADVNATDEDGWTALMFAAGNEDPEVASVLLKAGADVNAKANDGWTALMAADNSGVASVLLKAGADVNAKNAEGRTVLDLSRDKDAEIVALLKKAGAK